MVEENKSNIPIITIILVAINMVVFLYVAKNGDYNDAEYMLSVGAMSTDLVVGQHQFYRLITNIFLHFGWEHIMNNMFSLVLVGYTLENMIGRVKFLLVYFISGISGSVFGIINNLFLNGDIYTVSAGASGAIYGVLGGVFAMYLFSKNRQLRASLPRFLIFLVISLYAGFKDPTVGGDAHLGGLVAGFIMCMFFSLASRKKIMYNIEE